MKIKKKLLSCLFVITLVSSSIVGCSSSKTDGVGDSTAKQVLNYSTNSVVVGLNPILNTTAPDNGAHNMVSEPLLRERTMEDNKSEIIPAGASEYTVSEDGKTYTFKFKDDRKWSDGVAMTAKDYEYTLKLMADPKVAATNAWLYEGVIEGFNDALYNGADPNAIGVSCPDDMTLEIKLINPASYFPELVCSLYPVRQDKYEEWGSSYGTTPEKTLYSGPFVVESWNQNTEMVLAKNDNYWKSDKMKLEKLNYKVIQESATAVQAFINKELDIVSTSDPNWSKQIEADGTSDKYSVPDNAPDFIMFNTKNKYLQNTKIRQALSIAMDREALKEMIWNGNAVTNLSAIPDTMNIGEKSYTELVGGKNYIVEQLKKDNPDPKALLIEGLKELGKSPDTSQVNIRYASRGTNEISKKTAELLKQTWEEALGIKVEIDMMEWNIMWEKIDAGDYDMASAGWGPYYNEPSGILSLFEPERGNFNAEKTGWNNEDSKKFKTLLEEAKNETDEQKLAEIYLEAEQLLVGTAIIAPQYQTKGSTYINKKVEGYHVTTNGNTDWTDVSVK
ncbi:peptide ABC transporter substrate-binding protein [Paraclostridium sordellii]|uniref:peptide ABC transporter substrate-binding protein n=1 Tax=Paraclostridium sordellii TaxID=1505 RepID=UPI00189C393B|nr:peptide ABC transporter substrate-binding protein [Paeniclostridium sordellii]MCR1848461.1 peptide ABC transporter substrate-binding protein [Paeniclostridium sordellii]